MSVRPVGATEPADARTPESGPKRPDFAILRKYDLRREPFPHMCAAAKKKKTRRKEEGGATAPFSSVLGRFRSVTDGYGLHDAVTFRTVFGAASAVLLIAMTIALLRVVEWRVAASVRPPVAVVAPLAPLPLPEEIDGNFLDQVETCLLPVAATQGYSLRLTSGYRSKEEQDAVFRQGRTQDGHIVTEVAGGRSLHNFGLAVDVVDQRRGYRIDWYRLGRIAAYCGLEQNDEGDQAHFMHRAGLSIEQLAVGYRPPRLQLPCPRMAERAAAGEPLTRQDLADCDAPAF